MLEFTICKFLSIVSAIFCLGMITPLALIYVVIRAEDNGRRN